MVDEALFEKASKHAKTLTNVSEENMLNLYGLYKQALNGPCNISKPAFWDFTGKAKWTSWKAIGDVSQDEAKEKYIALVRKLDNTWDETVDVDESARKSGFGVSVSTMARDECDEKEDRDKTILDWCKDGRLDEMEKCLRRDECSLNTVDENGLNVLHWAADRGHRDVIEYVLTQTSLDVNAVDDEGQSALHYASSCGHLEVVKLLLKHGVDVKLLDMDGMSAIDMCDDDEIKDLLSNANPS